MLSLDHVVFPVWDAERSLRFYRETMGLPLVQSITGDDWGGKAWLMLIFGLADGRELVLVALRGAKRPPPDGLAADVRHVAFSVASAAVQDEMRARLAAAGAEITDETHGDQRSIYVSDPNGVVLEITTPPSRADQVGNDGALRRALDWIGATAALTA